MNPGTITMTPSIISYTAAVARLLPIAQSDTTGGRVAAQVLLSTYNGNLYQLDATDLCNLDHDLLESCITVLSQRALTSREPHTLHPDFDEAFEKIKEVWSILNVRERYHRYYTT